MWGRRSSEQRSVWKHAVNSHANGYTFLLIHLIKAFLLCIDNILEQYCCIYLFVIYLYCGYSVMNNDNSIIDITRYIIRYNYYDNYILLCIIIGNLMTLLY